MLDSLRHFGMVRRTRPGISRFRVRAFSAPRNDAAIQDTPAPCRSRNFKSAALVPHDFAVRFTRVRLARLKRPSHPAPDVRDDRDTPLRWAETAKESGVIWVRREGKSFSQRDWTGRNSLIGLRKSVFARMTERGNFDPSGATNRAQPARRTSLGALL